MVPQWRLNKVELLKVEPLSADTTSVLMRYCPVTYDPVSDIKVPRWPTSERAMKLFTPQLIPVTKITGIGLFLFSNSDRKIQSELQLRKCLRTF